MNAAAANETTNTALSHDELLNILRDVLADAEDRGLSQATVNRVRRAVEGKQAGEPGAPTRCGCVQRMNEALRTSNPNVKVLTDLRTGRPMVSTVRTQGRGGSPLLFPTYCPFCGIKYGD